MILNVVDVDYFQLLSALVMSAAVMIVCRATPVQPPFADESQDTNEIGPEEDWKLYNQIAKIRLSDDDEAAADEEKTKRLMKEIKEFTQLVSTVAAATPDESTTLDESTTPDDRAETETETERDSASSDWFTSTWRAQLNRNDDGQMSWQRAAAQENGADDGGDEDVSDVEEIIKKIRKDLKRLYNKIKEVVKVVKNWYAMWSIANTVLTAASG